MEDNLALPPILIAAGRQKLIEALRSRMQVIGVVAAEAALMTVQLLNIGLFARALTLRAT